MGESDLLRSRQGRFATNEVAVMDRYYGSFMMIALLLPQGTQTRARKQIFDTLIFAGEND